MSLSLMRFTAPVALLFKFRKLSSMEADMVFGTLQGLLRRYPRA